jgi:hypothetical protein
MGEPMRTPNSVPDISNAPARPEPLNRSMADRQPSFDVAFFYRAYEHGLFAPESLQYLVRNARASAPCFPTIHAAMNQISGSMTACYASIFDTSCTGPLVVYGKRPEATDWEIHRSLSVAKIGGFASVNAKAPA